MRPKKAEQYKLLTEQGASLAYNFRLLNPTVHRSDTNEVVHMRREEIEYLLSDTSYLASKVKRCRGFANVEQ